MRLRRPGYKTCLLIYKALSKGEKSFRELQTETGKSPTRLTYALDFLVEHGLAQERRSGYKNETVFSLMPHSDTILFNSESKKWTSLDLLTGRITWLGLIFKPSKTDSQRIRRLRRQIEKDSRTREEFQKMLDWISLKPRARYEQLKAQFLSHYGEKFFPTETDEGEIPVETTIDTLEELLEASGHLCPDCAKKRLTLIELLEKRPSKLVPPDGERVCWLCGCVDQSHFRKL